MTTCVPGARCEMLTAAHADDYEIAGVSVHLDTGEWLCPVHEIGDSGGWLTVTWGEDEVSLDAIEAVREGAAAADRELTLSDIRATAIRTPVYLSIDCAVPDEMDAAAQRRLAAGLSGVVLDYAVGATDTDRTVVELSFVGFDADTEADQRNRAVWAADALFSDRGQQIAAYAAETASVDELGEGMVLTVRAEVGPQAVAIIIEIMDLGDLEVETWLRVSEPVADREDLDWLIARTEDAIHGRGPNLAD